jgi:Lrp/AsnC family transcriptional regulator for asnA, asnC and gidA
MKLDDLDRKILEKLRENAMKPFVKIAQELGVTEGTIRLRVKKLSGGGVIRRFTVDVEASNVGLPVVAFITLSVTPGKIPEAAADIARIERVVEIHQTHTLGDLLVKLRAKDLDELSEILANQLRKVRNVGVINAIPVLKIWKDVSA